MINYELDEKHNKEIKVDQKVPKRDQRLDFSKKKYMAFKFMYIGKNYDGLVLQKHTTNTIEEQIFNALKKSCLIEDSEKCNYSRCGRTDAGVSSTGNVFAANLRSKVGLDYINIINNLLPKDITIIGSSEVDSSFDARFSCLYREYKYFFIACNMNIDKIKEGCNMLEGVHNFKNFCKIDKSNPNYLTKNYERRIYEFSIEKCDKLLFPSDNSNNIHNPYLEMYCATIKGSAFLWHQVRSMMAILFLIGKGLENTNLISHMLQVNDSQLTYNYEIASDSPLILSDCQFEGVYFRNTMENHSKSFFNIEKIYQQNLIQIASNSFFLRKMSENTKTIFLDDKELKPVNNEHKEKDNNLKNNNHSNINIQFFQSENNILEYFESNYRQKKKYTQLLQHKLNRSSNKKSKNRSKEKNEG